MHRNAPLTPEGRLRLCQRIQDGWSVAATAESMNLSRQTAHKWWRRYRDLGWEGLLDRSSRPRRCPSQTSPAREAQIIALRQASKFGPLRLGAITAMPASTVHAVLLRHGMNRVCYMDRVSGQVIRRIETKYPGELVHMDVKKLARIPDGGGWKPQGIPVPRWPQGGRGGRPMVGYGALHSVIDGHSRLAYSEMHKDEKATTVVGFFLRAQRFFADHGVSLERVLTDNGAGYRSKAFAALVAQAGIRHTRTRPYRPQTNGKAERFNRTLLDEWAYVRPYTSEAARVAALEPWLHMYNHHRTHTVIGGPPVSRVNNLPGHHT